MSETPEAIKARLKVYDVIGTISGYSLIVGLCGMAVCGIWRAPQWGFNVAASMAVLVGILTAFMLLNYSGAKALLREAKASNLERKTTT